MPSFVHLAPDGKLLVEDERGKARLKSLTGRFEWLPSTGDVLLLVRTPSSGATAEAPRVSLAGDVASTGLAEVIEFLHQGRRTGTLRVVASSGDRSIVLKEGTLRGATSDDVADSLAEVCLKLGLVQKSVLDTVLRQSGVAKLGRALVDANALPSHDLFKALQHQATEIFHSMILAREGAFVFIDEPVEAQSGGLQMNAQGLLMDSVRRIDEMAQFRRRLPSGKLFIVRRKPKSESLEPEEQRIYDLSTGERSVFDIAREMRLSEFDATKHLYHLIQGGFVAASPTPVGGTVAAKRNDPAEVARVFNQIFSEVLRDVARHQVGAEFLASANGALQSEATTRSPVLQGLFFGGDGALDADKLLQNAKAKLPEGAQGARALFQALSEVMFFLLFSAGEVLTPAEDEALAQRVKALLATVDPG
jgi:hypothetical protein